MREYFASVNNNAFGIIRIFIGYRDGKDVYLLRNNVFEKIDLVSIEEATIEISPIINAEEPGLLRALLDGLLAVGIKPSVPIENTSELKAVKYHLEDMRKLVFNVKAPQE